MDKRACWGRRWLRIWPDSTVFNLFITRHRKAWHCVGFEGPTVHRHHPRRREAFANDTGGCVMEWSVDVDAMVVNGRDWEGGKYMESALTWCKVIRAAIFHYSCFNYGNRLAMMLLMAILYTIADPALHITHQWRILACNQSVCNTAVIDGISLMLCNAIRIRMFRSVEGHFTDQEAINMIKEMVVLLQYKLQRGRNWIYFNTRIIIIIDAAHTTIPL